MRSVYTIALSEITGISTPSFVGSSISRDMLILCVGLVVTLTGTGVVWQKHQVLLEEALFHREVSVFNKGISGGYGPPRIRRSDDRRNKQQECKLE